MSSSNKDLMIGCSRTRRRRKRNKDPNDDTVAMHTPLPAFEVDEDELQAHDDDDDNKVIRKKSHRIPRKNASRHRPASLLEGGPLAQARQRQERRNSSNNTTNLPLLRRNHSSSTTTLPPLPPRQAPKIKDSYQTHTTANNHGSHRRRLTAPLRSAAQVEDASFVARAMNGATKALTSGLQQVMDTLSPSSSSSLNPTTATLKKEQQQQQHRAEDALVDLCNEEDDEETESERDDEEIPIPMLKSNAKDDSEDEEWKEDDEDTQSRRTRSKDTIRKQPPKALAKKRLANQPPDHHPNPSTTTTTKLASNHAIDENQEDVVVRALKVAGDEETLCGFNHTTTSTGRRRGRTYGRTSVRTSAFPERRASMQTLLGFTKMNSGNLSASHRVPRKSRPAATPVVPGASILEGLTSSPHPPPPAFRSEVQRSSSSSSSSNNELNDDPIIDFPEEQGVSTKRQRTVTKPQFEPRSTGVHASSFHSKPTKRQTRSSSQQAKLRISPTHSSSSFGDSEYEWSANEQYEFSTSRAPSSPKWHTVARISIGKKVFSKKCSFRFTENMKRGMIELAYTKNKSEKVTHSISLEDDSVQEIKYFVPDSDSDQPGKSSAVVVIDGDEDDLAFLAMRINPNEANGLHTYSNSYDPAKDTVIRKYVTVEFRSPEAFRKVLTRLRKDKHHLGAYMTEDAKLDAGMIPTYAAALMKDSDQEKENRFSSPRKRRSARSHKKGKDTNNVLLVYPFDGDEDEIDAAANGLVEASLVPLQATANGDDNSDKVMSCELAIDHVADEDKMIVDSASNEDVEMMDADDGLAPAAALTKCDSTDDGDGVPNGSCTADSGKNDATATRSCHRHFLTITEEDRDRCAPTVYLNDSLVDFWMQWIWRKEDRSISPLHIFSSHFYSTLSEGNGLEAVTTWTAKKNIDVFSKRFIFIPVNKALHWSLCVVVNPGAIVHEFQSNFSDDSRKACILFLDSLKAHRMREVAGHIRTWLNSEWKRLDKPCLSEKPMFDKSTMQVFAPKIPYQENGWDCGVFVCRYAYAFYQRRHKGITYADFSNRFEHAITLAPEFQFGMADIARVREELGVLVDRLSKIYLAHKETMRQKEKNDANQGADMDGSATPNGSVEQNAKAMQEAVSNEAQVVLSDEKNTEEGWI